MLAWRSETELIIESSHPVDIDLGYIQKLSNLEHGLVGEISKLFLNFLQKGDEVFSFAPYSFE